MKPAFARFLEVIYARCMMYQIGKTYFQVFRVDKINSVTQSTIA